MEEKLVYVSEDAMDCFYDESNGTSTKLEMLNNVSSPEMFGSDIEDNLEKFDTTSSFKSTTKNEIPIPASPCKPTQEELIARSDYNLLSRINKYLSGVPPPPKHTICQNDCNDFLLTIRQNAHLFWCNPSELEKKSSVVKTVSPSIEQSKDSSYSNSFRHRVKHSSRNLSIAFDACDGSRDSEIKDDSKNNCNSYEQSIDLCSTDLMENTSVLIDKTTSLSVNPSTNCVDSRLSSNGSKSTIIASDQPALYSTVSLKNAASLSWPNVYQHKCFGIQ